MTKELSTLCKAKVIAVGDDWQSIYAFSGSDITLFTHFCDIMGYSYIEARRGNPHHFISDKNKNSRVAVINTKNSNISSISDEDYIDGMYMKLIEEYNYPVDRAAIFLLFDFFIKNIIFRI